MKYAKILVTLFLLAAADSFARWDIASGGIFSADGSKVAYVSNETGDYRIYTVDADGSAKVRFDLKGGVWGVPYFSPDGSKIAFINDDRNFPNGNVFLVDADGKNLKLLTAYGDDPFEYNYLPDQRIGALDEGLTFSPDGRRILYISEELGSKDIFAINVDGTGKTRLTAFAGCDESGPVFLPGGDEVLFTVKGSWDKAGIWTMKADGSGKRRLSYAEDVELVALSPDGKRLAYAKRDGEWFRSYHVADLDGSSRLLFFGAKIATLDLSFSPDGKKVLYSLRPFGEIHIADADGWDRKKLPGEVDSVSSPAFFADGAKIAFVGSGRPGYADNIYTMDVDGSDRKAFKATAGMSISDLVVSPTGDRFLFKGDYYGGLGSDRFVVNADGTGLARLTTWYSWYRPYGGKFSADGSKVAYLSNETGDYHIYTVNADGTGKVKFELEGGLWGEPNLSPDGKKVAFVNYYEFFQKGNIFLVDVDGRNLTQVTAYGDNAGITDGPDHGIALLDEGLTFSPDGRKVLYCSNEFGSKDIFAINVDGTGKKRLTDFADCAESGPVFLRGGDEALFTAKANRGELETVFLPDGKKVLVTAKGSREKAGIWIMKADGSGKKKVPFLDDAAIKAVSPDGKKILAYATYRSEDFADLTWAAIVADLDGSAPVKIADAFELLDDPSFSPDGKKVLYRHKDGIFVANADGSGRKALTLRGDIIRSPFFFADGAKIAFVGRRQLRDARNIYTMDADGSNLKLFKATEGMDPWRVVVSPTGDRFLFRSYYGATGDGEGDYFAVNGEADYFVVNADGSGLVPLSAYDPPPWPTEEE